MSDWRLTADNTVLVIVDVQEKLMAVMPHRDEVVADIKKLAAAAKILGIPTLVTTQYTKAIGPTLADVAAAAGQPAAMDKLTFSCCGNAEFTRTLKDLRRQRVIVCGVEAHVCVQQTVIDLMKDYFVYVAVDAVSSRRDLDRDVAIERMRDCGAVITTVESAIFELLREAGTEQFKACLPLFK
jgi:nicotinamidase-related amidase